jgi:hypothetical protein
MSIWPFIDSPNVAVFTSKKILDGTAWIYRVSHDEEDGAWQFHPIGGTAEEDAKVVGLKTMWDIDQSIAALSDLPLGWCATRSSVKNAWKRKKL